MGRAGTAAFIGFLVLLAFAAVWVIERDVEGPAVTKEDVPQSAALDSPAETPIAKIDGETAQEPPPLIGTTEPPPTAPKAVAPGEPEGSPLPERVVPGEPEGSPLPERNVEAGLISPEQSRRQTRLAPPQRPAPRAIESAPPPPQRIPFPTSPPLPQQVMRTPPVEPAPASPRIAVAEAVPAPLPRVEVEELVLNPPATPPEPPPAPAAAAAVPVPAPAPATRPAPANAPAVDAENSAIRDVLGRYRSAFNTLDARAAHQVWPSVNERTLDRAFGQLQAQNVSFDRCTIAVKGVLAEANCSGTTRFVPRVGSRSEQIEARQWNFSLRKAYSGGWVIQEVEAR
jgi:hypothetical protein